MLIARHWECCKNILAAFQARECPTQGQWCHKDNVRVKLLKRRGITRSIHLCSLWANPTSTVALQRARALAERVGNLFLRTGKKYLLADFFLHGAYIYVLVSRCLRWGQSSASWHCVHDWHSAHATLGSIMVELRKGIVVGFDQAQEISPLFKVVCTSLAPLYSL